MKNITWGRRKATRKARVLFQVFLFSILLFVPSFLLSLPLFFFLSPLSLLFLPSQLFLPLWPRLPLNLQSCPHPCSAGMTSTHHHALLCSLPSVPVPSSGPNLKVFLVNVFCNVEQTI